MSSRANRLVGTIRVIRVLGANRVVELGTPPLLGLLVLVNSPTQHRNFLEKIEQKCFRKNRAKVPYKARG